MSKLFKLTLFSFLCSIVCTVGYILTSISVIGLAANWTWLITYGCLVAWLCRLLYVHVKRSIALVFVVASFALALYFGVRLSLTDGIGNINELFLETMDATLFVCSALICVVSIIALIGQMIFGTKKQDEKVVANAENASQADERIIWVCNCGSTNTGKFCSECGSINPANGTVLEDEA